MVGVDATKVGRAGSGGKRCRTSLFDNSRSVKRWPSNHNRRINFLGGLVDKVLAVKRYMTRATATCVSNVSMNFPRPVFPPFEAAYAISTKVWDKEFLIFWVNDGLMRVRSLLPVFIRARSTQLNGGWR